MQAFDVLADPVRRHILELISSKEHTSGEIVAVIKGRFGISQSAVSQHLRILRDHGFATARHQGTRRCYSIQTTGFDEIHRWLNQFSQLWTPRLEALATEVSRGKKARKKSDD